MAQRQTGLRRLGNLSRYPPLPKAESANPSKEPSMPASFTSTNSESEIALEVNPLSIHSGRKPL
jgi:hypothetical protein